MIEQHDPPKANRRTTNNERAIMRGGLTCSLVVFTVIDIPICFVVWRFVGVGDMFMLTIKSFEFPFIEARYQPISDALATVTQDTLLKEGRSIGNVTSETHRDSYTGCVAGHFTKIYGANRSFESVLADYAQFFSIRSDWEAGAEKGQLAKFYKSPETGLYPYQAA